MRNLVGRFAGFVLVAVCMMVIACIWCLIVCWKLTLVGLATTPVVYGITHAFELVSSRWETKSNDAGEAAGGIFTETFSNIRTVRALTLEGYLHKKYARYTRKAFKIGLGRAAYSGLFYGVSDATVVFLTGTLVNTRSNVLYRLT
jgi:ATP-binding cassette subfamily B (MDR/TAP) protein 1